MRGSPLLGRHAMIHGHFQAHVEQIRERRVSVPSSAICTTRLKQKRKINNGLRYLVPRGKLLLSDIFNCVNFKEHYFLLLNNYRIEEKYIGHKILTVKSQENCYKI